MSRPLRVLAAASAHLAPSGCQDSPSEPEAAAPESGCAYVHTESDIVDVVTLWKHRYDDDRRTEEWDWLMHYYDDAGLPMLASTDLADLVPVADGSPEGSDLLGWDGCPSGSGRS